MVTSDHFAAAELARLCAEHGVRFAVTSPGSRSAPLIIALCNEPGITCLQVIDERSAGFFALGMAEQLSAPVALICTSGSAILNYGPAVAEAFYKRVPLVVISADRPQEWMDQGEGQAIRQEGVLDAHTRLSVQLPRDPADELARWNCIRSINMALDAAVHPVAGPVHLNVPFDEPLYGRSQRTKASLRTVTQIPTTMGLGDGTVKELVQVIDRSRKVMILVGQGVFDEQVRRDLRTLATLPQITVMTEATSNLDEPEFLTCIDRVLEGVGAADADELAPELLITFGGAVISKRVKALIRKWSPVRHWNVDLGQRHYDTYQCLSDDIAIDPAVLLQRIVPRVIGNESTYRDDWRTVDERTRSIHEARMPGTTWSDLAAIGTILDHIPEGSDVHLANSTPARYVQLFTRSRGHRFWSNRGVSGIDGCTSTAVGAAFATDRLTTLITGETAFLYDSNAFWNNHVSAQLRIIVIDNGGGNIFRYIDGPDRDPDLLRFFEAPHGRDPAALARSYGIRCFEADDMGSLKAGLGQLYSDGDDPCVLVVRTDPKTSPQVLRDHFAALRG